jgi:hypothetical protein
MTENVEGLTPEEQEQSPAAPASVSGSEGQQLSQQGSQDGVSRDEFDRVVNELRGLQGKQDKIEHQFSSQFEITAQELGVKLDPEQRLELRLRKLEEQRQAPVDQSSLASEQVQPTEDYAQVIKSLEMDANDPRVLKAAIQYNNDPVQLKAALVDIKTSKQQSPPSPAAAVTPGGSDAPATNRQAIQTEIDSILTDPAKSMTSAPMLWDDKTFEGRAQHIIDCFTTLTDEQVESVTKVWSKNEYNNSPSGEDEAISDLMRMLRYESLSEEQRREEDDRLALWEKSLK